MAEAELEQAVLGHLPVAAGGGAIHAYGGGGEVVDLQDVLVEVALAGSPGGRRSGRSAAAGSAEPSPARGAAARPTAAPGSAGGRPATRYAQPDRRQPAPAQALVVDVRRQVRIKDCGSPRRCMWASSSGTSSTRSVWIVGCSLIPRAYPILPTLSRFKRTVSPISSPRGDGRHAARPPSPAARSVVQTIRRTPPGAPRSGGTQTDVDVPRASEAGSRTRQRGPEPPSPARARCRSSSGATGHQRRGRAPAPLSHALRPAAQVTCSRGMIPETSLPSRPSRTLPPAISGCHSKRRRSKYCTV